ncbi:hypothetical protein V6N13_057013 [Hibiscus sabdariffa]
MPPVFSDASSSQFQSPMAPPTEGFFVGAFQPYSSMMTAPLHFLRNLPLDLVGAVITPLMMRTLMRLGRTMMTTMHLFKEIPVKTFVH